MVTTNKKIGWCVTVCKNLWNRCMRAKNSSISMKELYKLKFIWCKYVKFLMCLNNSLNKHETTVFWKFVWNSFTLA